MAIESSENVEFESGQEAEAPEIEIIDDTPEEDRGRKPLPPTAAEQTQEEELDAYSSAAVQKRINQLSHRYHDERRAKEALERQNQEAIRLAQTILAENEHLKQTLTWGQQEYVNEVKAKIEYAEKLAEDKYRKAFETGDTDGVMAAEKERLEARLQKEKLNNLQLPINPQQNVTPPLQSPQYPVNSQQYVEPERPAPPSVDHKAQEWAARNPWFGADEEMTSLAYGLHTKLVNSGVDPKSDEYYAHIDKRMREVFPEQFGKKQRASSPVAPAGRSTAGRKVTLTATQVALAKRLGVPLEQYAKHVSKLEQHNG